MTLKKVKKWEQQRLEDTVSSRVEFTDLRTDLKIVMEVNNKIRKALFSPTNKEYAGKFLVKRVEQYSNGSNSGHELGSDIVNFDIENLVEELDTEDTIYGSSPLDRELHSEVYDSARKIESANTEQVFNELLKDDVISDSDEHVDHLRDILRNITNKVVKPFQLLEKDIDDHESVGATQGNKVYLFKQKYPNGVEPAYSSIMNTVRMSTAEIFSHELVHRVSHHALRNNELIRREVKKLWSQAKEVITINDFMSDPNLPESDPTYETEFKAAKQRYDYIFNPRSSAREVNGSYKSNYLDEFVAFGLTNERFKNQLRDKITYRTKDLKEANTFFGKLQNMFTKMLNYINGIIQGTKGKTGDEQLISLYKSMANVDTSVKAQINARLKKTFRPYRALSEPINEGVRIVTENFNKGIKQPIKQGVDFITASEDYQEAYENFNNVYKESVKKIKSTALNQAEFLTALAVEMKSNTKLSGKYHELLRQGKHNVDTLRETVRVGIRKSFNSAFDKHLTDEEKIAMTNTFLRTNFTSLVQRYGRVNALGFITNPSALNQEIKDVRNLIIQQFGSNANHYIKQATNLGQFSITGENKIALASLNSENISKLYGTGKAVPTNADQAVELIETLAALTALNTTSFKTRNMVGDIITNELSRSTRDNGIFFLLNLMETYKTDVDKDFEGNEAHKIFGYVKDVVNPDIDTVVATADQGNELAKHGYERVSQLGKDYTNTVQTEPLYLYVNRQGGLADRQSGIVYLNTDKAKGNSVNKANIQGIKNPGNVNSIAVAQRKLVNNSFGSTKIKPEANYMVPTFDTNGNITDFRYMESSRVKDELKQRDLRIDDLLGRMKGDLAIKPNMKKSNITTVKAMHEQFKEDFAKNPEDYVVISEQSGIGKHREIWRLLPQEMKEEANKLFGSDKLIVRKEFIPLIFGQAKYSFAKALTKEDRNAFYKLVRNILERVLGKNALPAVFYTEKGLIALATWGKDNIVVRSLFVTLGNTLSNLHLLTVKGIPPHIAIANYAIAWKAHTRYKQQINEVTKLRNKIKYSEITSNKRFILERRLVELEDDINNNPIKPLVDEGMLSTIVEDLTEREDLHSLQRDVIGKIQDRAKSIGKNVPLLGKITGELLETHGSSLYGVLNDAAQFSDFGARYVLYKHLTGKKKNPKSHRDAIVEAMDTFIYFDTPTHPSIQYLNDTGIFPFTKFLLRTQKVIFNTLKENPARVLGLHMIENLTGMDVDDIYESTLGVTNPFDRVKYPFEMLGTEDNILTINTLKNIL